MTLRSLAVVTVLLSAGKADDPKTFEAQFRAALKGVLISPEFLFLREQPGKLDDFALVNRLSYFLWSTMPDEELLDLAEKGALSGEREKNKAAASPVSVSFPLQRYVMLGTSHLPLAEPLILRTGI